MERIADILHAVAAIAWPILGFTVLGLYHREIRAVLARIKRGKILGQEIELREEVQGLLEVSGSLRALPAGVSPASTAGEKAVDIREKVLVEAARSPASALLFLKYKIEMATRELHASAGFLENRGAVPLAEMIREMGNEGYIPRVLIQSAESFLSVCDKIVDVPLSSGDGVLMSAIYSGLAILDAIQSVPHEKRFVAHVGVTAYSDPNCTKARADVTVVLLDARRSDGSSAGRSAHPTTSKNLVVGKPVSWEWNLQRLYGETWYRDPISNEIQYGWGGSAEFVGRTLDQL